MPEETPIQALGGRLLPWLREPLAQFESAQRSGRLGHAWILAGPRGVGKINLALAAAQRLLTATAGGPPPPELGPAEAVAAMAERHDAADHHPDLHWVHPEGERRTIAIEQVREVSETLGLKGYSGAAKVVILEPAEAMTIAAANALLKTLEEPTAESYLLLVSHEPQRLPPTVRSRCQRLTLARPPREQVRQWLRDAPEGPFETAWLLADGSPLRLAERLLGSDSSLPYKELEDELIAVSTNRTDPQAVAARWVKLDPTAVLEWLSRRIELAIRARLARATPTPVTDIDPRELHNAWADVPSRTLFERLDTAQKLLNRSGTGLNMELALRALLLDFQGRRGET
ncbi:MAG TPA: hypothetical protein VF322_13070 [Gammaproteobacteria bacterium]